MQQYKEYQAANQKNQEDKEEFQTAISLSVVENSQYADSHEGVRSNSENMLVGLHHKYMKMGLQVAPIDTYGDSIIEKRLGMVVGAYKAHEAGCVLNEVTKHWELYGKT